MLELHDLRPSPGSRAKRKRLGRGPGSGSGKTAGRGQKGQRSRSGHGIRPGFEGGQMPLTRRIPKRGFKRSGRVEYQVVNVRDLTRVDGKVDPTLMKEAGLISSLGRPVKVLGLGEIDRPVHVSAHGFSATARTKIEEAGGSVTIRSKLREGVAEGPKEA